MYQEENRKNSIREYAETISICLTIVASILGSCLWINSKFTEIEKDIAIIKTVLVMKQILPAELAKHEDKK